MCEGERRVIARRIVSCVCAESFRRPRVSVSHSCATGRRHRRSSSSTVMLRGQRCFRPAGRHLLLLSLALVVSRAVHSQQHQPIQHKQCSQVNYLLAAETIGERADASVAPASSSSSLNPALLNDLLGRVGPDMRPTSGFTDEPDISIEVAQHAWRSMREHASRVAAAQMDALWPSVSETLETARVSAQCARAAKLTADATRRLELWAIQRKFTRGRARRS